MRNMYITHKVYLKDKKHTLPWKKGIKYILTSIILWAAISITNMVLFFFSADENVNPFVHDALPWLDIYPNMLVYILVSSLLGLLISIPYLIFFLFEEYLKEKFPYFFIFRLKEKAQNIVYFLSYLLINIFLIFLNLSSEKNLAQERINFLNLNFFENITKESSNKKTNLTQEKLNKLSNRLKENHTIIFMIPASILKDINNFPRLQKIYSQHKYFFIDLHHPNNFIDFLSSNCKKNNIECNTPPIIYTKNNSINLDIHAPKRNLYKENIEKKDLMKLYLKLSQIHITILFKLGLDTLILGDKITWNDVFITDIDVINEFLLKDKKSNLSIIMLSELEKKFDSKYRIPNFNKLNKDDKERKISELDTILSKIIKHQYKKDIKFLIIPYPDYDSSFTYAFIDENIGQKNRWITIDDIKKYLNREDNESQKLCTKVNIIPKHIKKEYNDIETEMYQKTEYLFMNKQQFYLPYKEHDKIGFICNINNETLIITQKEYFEIEKKILTNSLEKDSIKNILQFDNKPEKLEKSKKQQNTKIQENQGFEFMVNNIEFYSLPDIKNNENNFLTLIPYQITEKNFTHKDLIIKLFESGDFL